MRRDAQGSSARSTDGGGSRSGAPSRRRSLAFLGALVLAITVSLGAAAAIADSPPVVTIDNSPSTEYTVAEVEGTVNPSGGPSATQWHFEYTTTPADESSWLYGPGGEIAGPDAEGNSPIPVSGTIEFLQPETEYSVRLVAENDEGANRVVSAAPYPAFTTKGPVPPATVTIDPVTTFTGTTAHFSGKIDPGAAQSDPGFDVGWRFECEPACVAVVPGGGRVEANGTEQEVKADATVEPNTSYTIKLIGTNAGGPVVAETSFQTPLVAPEVQTLPAFALRGGTEALVGGSVNPNNSATTYWVEYGPTTAYGQKAPLSPADAGAGGARRYVTERIAGLTPSTVYHVRLVAESSGGRSEGVDQNFETAPASEAVAQGCPNATLRVENNSTALPECRAYEQVSPIDKNGFNVGQLPPGNGEESYVAAEVGSKVTFLSPGAFADSRSAFLTNSYIASRTAAGWTTHALIPPIPPKGVAIPRLSWSTPDLKYVALGMPSGYHLAPGDFPGSTNLYRADTATGELTTVTSGNIAPENANLKVLGGSSDGRTIYFDSDVPLVEGEPDSPFSSIYEWNEGELRLASTAPNGDPLPYGGNIASLPSGNTYVSRDGSRLIFKSGAAGTEQLYLRENGQTYEVGPGAENPTFVGATPDLSQTFLLTASALTPDAVDDSHIKLYRYNAGPKTLTLISPTSTDGGNAQNVRGVSQDGSYVYFRSESQYVPGQGIRGRDGSTNLYVWHNGEISFITTEFFPPNDEPIYTKFRVSPNGKRVSFESADRLTAYDNTDATLGAGGEVRADTEVYVYDTEAKRLTCVSCNPSGERPSGTAEGRDAGSTFPSQALQPTRLQPGVGDDGHIFFNSRDALVPADVNGVEDVYEWRDGQVHLISSGVGADPASYATSSINGEDVFFTTIRQMIGSDRDGLSDLYDARINGGYQQATEQSLCEGLDVCHGPESQPPTEGSIGSLNGRPEPKADSARLRLRKALKKALRACNHKPKKKRARCKAAARKRFKKAQTRRAH